MTHYLDKIDPTFKADLRASMRAVHFVADWLRSLGHDVQVHDLKVRPDPSVRFDYSDNGDLTVDGQRVEVKHLSHEFTSVQSFKYLEPIVDKVHAYDRAEPKAAYYLLCNASLTGCLRVFSASHSQWHKRETSVGNRDCLFYMCPKSVCEYVSFLP